MPEKLRFGGALAVVLLLLFAARFRAAMSWNNTVRKLENRIVLIHITDIRCGELVVFASSDSHARTGVGSLATTAVVGSLALKCRACGLGQAYRGEYAVAT